MAGGIDECLFRLCKATPEKKNDPFALFGGHPYNLVGERFPPPALVGPGLVGSYGEGGIEQQNTLAGPGLQVAVARDFAPHILVELFKDINQ